MARHPHYLWLQTQQDSSFHLWLTPLLTNNRTTCGEIVFPPADQPLTCSTTDVNATLSINGRLQALMGFLLRMCAEQQSMWSSPTAEKPSPTHSVPQPSLLIEQISCILHFTLTYLHKMYLCMNSPPCAPSKEQWLPLTGCHRCPAPIYCWPSQEIKHNEGLFTYVQTKNCLLCPSLHSNSIQAVHKLILCQYCNCCNT